MAAITIRYEDATCADGERLIVDSLSLDVAAGEMVALVGPPGCGKATALRMVAGLEPVTAGRILIEGDDVTARPPFDRRLAMVQGDQMLYPHLSVGENLGFSMKVRGRSRSERRARVAETARLLELDDAKLRVKPEALTPVDRSLAALGRAVARGVNALLLHEPLVGLDSEQRAGGLAKLAALQGRLRNATILVTDDVDAALAIADRVAVMEAGKLVAIDTARSLYARPANAFVASAIGSPQINLRTVKVSASGAMLDAETVMPIPAHALGAARLENLPAMVVGYRPDAARPANASAPGALGLNVELVEPLGPQARVHGRLDSDSTTERRWVLTCESRAAPKIGERLHFTVDERAAHLFDPETGLRLN